MTAAAGWRATRKRSKTTRTVTTSRLGFLGVALSAYLVPDSAGCGHLVLPRFQASKRTMPVHTGIPSSGVTELWDVHQVGQKLLLAVRQPMANSESCLVEPTVPAQTARQQKMHPASTRCNTQNRCRWRDARAGAIEEAKDARLRIPQEKFYTVVTV